MPKSIARLASTVCARLGHPRVFRSEDVPCIETDYVGPGYAEPTDKSRTAIRLVARLEGQLLDPVYTGKAFAGLIDLVEKKQMGRDESIIFLHTGGVPGLFARPHLV